MIVLSNHDLVGLVPPMDLIAAMEDAALGVAQGKVAVPARTHADWQDNTLLTMPAVAQAYFGTKLVAVVPGNAARDLPVTNGLMILNDGETGLPLAVMNAAALTAQRTGAVGTLGVKYMTARHKVFLRLNGSATVTRDLALCYLLKEGMKLPKTVIKLAVKEAYFHCGKAFRRSHLWAPERWPDVLEYPLMGDYPVTRVDRTRPAAIPSRARGSQSSPKRSPPCSSMSARQSFLQKGAGRAPQRLSRFAL